MGDQPPDISEADLAGLADGTIAPQRCVELMARVRASAELTRALAEQQRALTVIRQASRDATPSPALRASLAAMVGEAPDGDRFAHPGAARALGRRRRWGRSLAAVGAAALAGLALALVLRDGSPPTVEQAARVALAAAQPAADPRARGGDDSAAGLRHAGSAGWRSVGTRRDSVDGRRLSTVFYADARDRRVGYTIVDDGRLPRDSDGSRVRRNGITLWTRRDSDMSIVTWVRDGRTCILAGRGVDGDELVTMAAGRRA
jgi:hypothetical protein